MHYSIKIQLNKYIQQAFENLGSPRLRRQIYPFLSLQDLWSHFPIPVVRSVVITAHPLWWDRQNRNKETKVISGSVLLALLSIFMVCVYCQYTTVNNFFNSLLTLIYFSGQIWCVLTFDQRNVLNVIILLWHLMTKQK